MNGILLIDKPVGWTSHDIVAKIRGILATEARSKKQESSSHDSSFMTHDSRGSKIRVGHAGTLDPAATGLLIVLVGGYTKKAAEFSKLDKTYEAELTLGATSSTGDSEGRITPTPGLSFSGLSSKLRPKITEVLQSFVGEIWQRPHPYSAVKVSGQRAYKMARQGKEVKLEPRKVRVYRLEVTEFKYPKLKIVAEVSSGTYIRSLAEDIGEKLGTGAYLSALRRTKVGDFDLKNALKIEELSLLSLQSRLQK